VGSPAAVFNFMAGKSISNPMVFKSNMILFTLHAGQTNHTTTTWAPTRKTLHCVWVVKLVRRKVTVACLHEEFEQLQEVLELHAETTQNRQKDIRNAPNRQMIL
jgi:hypothetical protein